MQPSFVIVAQSTVRLNSLNSYLFLGSARILIINIIYHFFTVIDVGAVAEWSKAAESGLKRLVREINLFFIGAGSNPAGVTYSF